MTVEERNAAQHQKASVPCYVPCTSLKCGIYTGNNIIIVIMEHDSLHMSCSTVHPLLSLFFGYVQGSVLTAVLCLLPVLSQRELTEVRETAAQMLSQQ